MCRYRKGFKQGIVVLCTVKRWRVEARDPTFDFHPMASSKSPLLHRVRVQPAGLVFINGMSSAYETEFPLELSGVVSEADFSRAIAQINTVLADFWPCLLCFGCGYGCCICSLGLSLFCPNLCISDVRPARPASERAPLSRPIAVAAA